MVDCVAARYLRSPSIAPGGGALVYGWGWSRCTGGREDCRDDAAKLHVRRTRATSVGILGTWI